MTMIVQYIGPYEAVQVAALSRKIARGERVEVEVAVGLALCEGPFMTAPGTSVGHVARDVADSAPADSDPTDSAPADFPADPPASPAEPTPADPSA